MMEPGAGIQKPVNFEEFSPYHKPAVIQLWKLFDEGETETHQEHYDDWLDRAADRDDPWVRGVVATTGRGHPVGFGLLGYYTEGDGYLDDWDVNHAEKYAALHLGCVSKRYQNRGIGTRLMGQRIEWAKASGWSELYGVSWNRDGSKDSGVLFEHFGFETVQTHPEDNYDDERVCPDCGDDCDCGATLYRLVLDADRRGDS